MARSFPELKQIADFTSSEMAASFQGIGVLVIVFDKNQKTTHVAMSGNVDKRTAVPMLRALADKTEQVGSDLIGPGGGLIIPGA